MQAKGRKVRGPVSPERNRTGSGSLAGPGQSTRSIRPKPCPPPGRVATICRSPPFATLLAVTYQAYTASIMPNLFLNGSWTLPIPRGENAHAPALLPQFCAPVYLFVSGSRWLWQFGSAYLGQPPAFHIPSHRSDAKCHDL